MIDQDELYGLRMFGVVAFQFPSQRNLVCAEATCLVHYADLMQTARPLTQQGVDEIQSDRDGGPINCECCGQYLDTFNRTAWK